MKITVCKVKVSIVLNFKGIVLTYHFFRSPVHPKQTKHFQWCKNVLKYTKWHCKSIGMALYDGNIRVWVNNILPALRKILVVHEKPIKSF